MKIGIAADHAGQRLKAAITEHLKAAGHTILAFGPETTPDDDYPLIVRPLAEAVARGDVDRGIFFCGSGIGPMVAANKIAGVRAAVAENEWSARDGVDAYLAADVQGGRHERRREQIRALESSPRAPQHGTKVLKGGVT